MINENEKILELSTEREKNKTQRKTWRMCSRSRNKEKAKHARVKKKRDGAGGGGGRGMVYFKNMKGMDRRRGTKLRWRENIMHGWKEVEM